MQPSHSSARPENSITAPSFGHPLSHLLAEPVACTFDDVLLLPGASETLPHQACIQTGLGRGVTLSMPLCAAAMDTVTEAPMAIALAELGALGVIHKNMSVEAQAREVATARAKIAPGRPVAAATGVGETGLTRSRALALAGASVLVIDTAHGHAKGVIDSVAALRAACPDVLLIAGNVATGPAALALFDAGADVVKVGVGPGSICTTRTVAGVGVPQLTAVTWVAAVVRALRKQGRMVACIADGGIRQSGDVVKALACGADAVMVGRLLAGADEAPGEVVERGGHRRKQYRGMGSLPAMQKGSAERYGHAPVADGASRKIVAEGVEATVPSTGPVADSLAQLSGGLRAGMGYIGAQTLAELADKARYVRQSPAGLVESGVHDVRVDVASPAGAHL